jgi:tartrate dehydrogenase/decarboxylase/D-malate dehydrogenase
MRHHRIAAIGGDGIGPEVIAAGLQVLDVVAHQDGGFRLQVEHFPWSSEYYLTHGTYIPDGGLERLRTFDAIFFGAVGSKDVADHVSLWGLRLPIAQGFDQYANVRPARVLPGVRSPLRNGEAIDWVIIRENSEGEYAGHGGRAHRGLPLEVATEVAVFTRGGVERIHRFAFELARKRPRKHLTLVTKSNAQRFGMVMWDEIFFEVAREYPDVESSHLYIDALCMQMVKDPRQFDVIVTNNMFGDIATDLGAQLQGGLGMAASGNLHPGRTSMFEPVHGSAPKYAGTGRANPFGAILTASLMLEHLGKRVEAESLERAVARCVREGRATSDVGGSLSTSEAGDAVCRALEFRDSTA